MHSCCRQVSELLHFIRLIFTLRFIVVILSFSCRAHIHTVGLLWTSNQLVAEASTYTQYNITYNHKRQTSMLRAGCKPAIPATKRPQTYALDRAAAGIGVLSW
jgi:hypothetical protein